MKITSVEIFKCYGSPPLQGNNEVFVVVVPKINTDAGISGYGEAGMCYGVGASATVGVLQDFSKKLIGKNPMNVEEIWRMLDMGTFWGNSGGPVINAGRSAIDIALWDIRGKALGVPVYELLGGKTNPRLRAYASQIQFDWGPVSDIMIVPDDYGKACKKAKDDGYDCIKVDPLMFSPDGGFGAWKTTGMLSNKHLQIACDRIAAIREVGGPDMDIIVELHAFTDTNTAIQLASALEPFHIYFYEEPTGPLSPHLFKEIYRNVNIPLAAGERLFTRWQYRQYFEDRSLSIIQPDMCNCGGITEAKKICDMAAVYDIGVQGHVCGGPISTAACLQLEAVIPNFVIHEQHQASLVKENIALCKYDYQPVNGMFEVPDKPGIGQELSEEAMEKAEKFVIQ